MIQGKADSLRLLQIVHRVAVADEIGLGDAARILADALGDVVVVFMRGHGQAAATVEAVCARDDDTAQEWGARLLAAGPLVRSSLGQTLILGRPKILPPGPWPAREGAAVQVLQVPVRAPRRIVGVIVLVRGAAEPPFSDAEVEAVAAVAARAGTLAALTEADRRNAGRHQESELLRSSLRFMAGFLASDLALEPLLVQARHALGAEGLYLLLGSTALGPLRLVAAAGPTAPPADPAVLWSLDTTGPIGLALEEGRTFYVADRADLTFGVGPAGNTPGGVSGPLWAAPVKTGAGFLGVLLATWPPGAATDSEIRALAGLIAELAALLASHAQLAREAVGARAAERLAAELAAQRDAIVRQIVHDLRNAVHALGLAVEDMEYRPDDAARVRAALSTVLRQTDFMGAYLKEKIRSLEAQPLDSPPPGSIEAAFRRLEGLGPRIAREGRTLRVGRMDPVEVKIPQIQLDQILERLVFEACRLANQGGTLEVWAAVADGWALITVEDDGPGLAPEAQARLASARRKRNGGTSGFQTVEELVAAAGGQFGLRTRLGDRTSFSVGLPSVGWAGGA